MCHREECSRLKAARTWLHGDFGEVSQLNACRVLGLRQRSAEEETAAGAACVEGICVGLGKGETAYLLLAVSCP